MFQLELKRERERERELVINSSISHQTFQTPNLSGKQMQISLNERLHLQVTVFSH